SIADFEHVGIVPVSRAGEFLQAVLAESNQRHAVVLVADVPRRPPEVSSLRSPAPRRLNTPIADAEHDGPSGLCQGVTKLHILHFRIKSFGVTPIHLHVVHYPRSIRLSVLALVIETSGPLLASQSSGIGIHSELHPLAMYVTGQAFDPSANSDRFRNNIPLRIAAVSQAVIS